jgi:hypothetical protein
MSYEGSMKGSGIYCEERDVEIVCAEKCSACEDAGQTCDNVWEATVMTDDWGNIDAYVECEKCKHSVNYRRERDDD